MKDQGVKPATLKPPTLQPRAEGFNQNNNHAVGGLQHGDNSNMTTYTYVGKMPSAFGQLDQALEDAKKTLEEEKMLIPEVKYKEENRIDETTDSKNSDDADFMDIRSNPDPVVRYAIANGTTKTRSRSKKKATKKSYKDERLVEAIKRALGEENETDGSYAQLARDNTFYSDDELVRFASRTISSSEYSDNSSDGDEDMSTLISSYNTGGTTSRHSTAADDIATLDETLLSGFTDDSATANFQSSFMCTSRKKKSTKQAYTRKWQRDRADSKSVISEPEYLDDVYDDYDDNTYDDDKTFNTKGTMGVVQDVLFCKTFACCGVGDARRYQPDEDSTVATKDTWTSKASTLSPMPTVKERLNRKRSKHSVSDDETEPTPKKENATEAPETLGEHFWLGDGVFTSDTSVATGLASTGAISETMKTTEISDGEVVWKGDGVFSSDESVATGILLQKTDIINDVSNTPPSQVDSKTDQKSVPATSEASLTSSTKKKKPYLLGAARSFGKSISFKKQRNHAQPPNEVPIDDDAQEASATTTTSNPEVPDVTRHQVEIDVETADVTEHNNLSTRSTASELGSQGYEIPRKKSFSQRLLSRRSSKRSSKQLSIPENPTSPARTVDASISTNSTITTVSTENPWKFTVDRSSGKTYFYNMLTKEVRWEAPEGFEQEERLSPLWKAAYDTTTGKTYYYNRQTKAVTWKKPKDLLVSN